MIVERVGKIVRDRRKELGITQATLADLCELSKNTIYQFERGQNNPSLRVVEKIFDVLGLRLEVTVEAVPS